MSDDNDDDNFHLLRPNLFKFATKELSQDAFLCWLIYWAKERYALNPLHQCAQEFLHYLTGLPKPIYPENVYRQHKKTDVAVNLGDYYFLIEDKTDSQADVGQIRGYERELENDSKFSRSGEKKRLPSILFISGNQFFKLSDEAKDIKVVRRSDLLDILRPYKDKTSDPIFLDFLSLHEDYEREFCAWKEKDVSGWDSAQITGFYDGLCKTDIFEKWDARYGYVPNQSGGFYALYWDVAPAFYFQMEYDNNKKGFALYLRASKDIPDIQDFRQFLLSHHHFEKTQTRAGSSYRVVKVATFPKDFLQNGKINKDCADKIVKYLSVLHQNTIEILNSYPNKGV